MGQVCGRRAASQTKECTGIIWTLTTVSRNTYRPPNPSADLLCVLRWRKPVKGRARWGPHSSIEVKDRTAGRQQLQHAMHHALFYVSFPEGETL
jgi:hypothetical protein